jgi:PAS domain S-box-containing protein
MEVSFGWGPETLTMVRKPTFDELQHRVKELENTLARFRQENAILQKSRGHLQAILDNTNLPIFLKTSDYEYIHVNRQYEMLAQVRNEEIIGKTDFDIFPQPVAELFRSQDEEVINRKVLVDFTETIPLADGEHSFITSKFPVHDVDGNIYAIGGVCTDITDLKKAEIALRESEEKFKNIIESSPMGVFIYRLEPDGRLVFLDANPAADDILQVDCKQFIGKTIEEAFPPLAETEIPERYRQVCQNGKPWHRESVDYQDGRIDGAFEVYVFQTEPYKAAVFFNDITQRRKMELDIQKIQKIESLGVLAGGIAHDFNNLLASILGNINLAIFNIKSDAEKTRGLLEEAEKASLRARDLTQQLLTFSKGGEPVKNVFSITEVVKDSAEFVLRGSNVTCAYQYPEDLWPVEIDAGQISQVVQNIIINGAHAMPAGGTIEIAAENYVQEEGSALPLSKGNFVRISFKDSGPGIPATLLNKIFDPYFTTKQKGSGLGLAVAYSIIMQHDGHIAAESVEGETTTFTMYLAAAEQRKLSEQPLQKPLELLGEGRVLVMDDEKMFRETVHEMLSHLGYEVVLTRNGTEAVLCFEQSLKTGKPFDLVLLDLTIRGGMGGKKTVQEIIALDSQAKVIVASGYSNDPVMSNFREYGFSGVISKPFRVAELSEVIQNL